MRFLLHLDRLILAFGVVGGLAAQSTPWTFVSIPDFQNNDVGSLADPNSAFPGNPSLPAGFVALDAQWDSCTANYHDSVDWIVGRLAGEDPEFVTVAGDLVMGHWERSTDGRQVFGPLSTDAQAAAAVDRAADYYYDIWRGRFDPARNAHLAMAMQALGRPLQPLPVHTVVGDHELGDNNWGVGSLKSRMVPAYKRAFARWFTNTNPGAATWTPRYATRPTGLVYERTAYAFQYRNVLTVVVDEFRQDGSNTGLQSNTGSVLATVDDGLAGRADDDQLAWLDGVLAAGRADPSVDFLIVQGHMPVLRPVRARNSSNLGVQDQNGATGQATGFWQTLSRHKVDAYFCGEVHDVSLSRAGGVTQIVHGALIGNHSPINYLVIDVHADRLEFELREIDVQLTTGSLWQTGSNRPRADFEITAASRAAGYRTSGHATLTKLPNGGGSAVTRASGRLSPYGTFEEGRGDLKVALPLDGLDTQGQFPNVVGLGNQGVPEGNAAPIAGGALGGAVALDGTQDRVLAGGTPIGGSDPRTVSVWVRSQPRNGLQTVLTFGSNVAGGKWDLDIDHASGAVFELGVGSGRTIGSGPRLDDGRWHMLTTVLPAGATRLNAVRMFVDGAFAYAGSSNTNQAINTGGGDLVLGHAANSLWFQSLHGDIDDVGIWARGLSDVEVAALHAVAIDPGLGYAVAEFDALLEVHAGREPRATLGAFTWRRVAGGMTGAAGLRGSAASGYEILLDPVAGSGVETFVPPELERFGAGCTGTGGLVPDLAGSTAPALNTPLFFLNLADARPRSAAIVVVNAVRGDVAVGQGCTLHPAAPLIDVPSPTDAQGISSVWLPISGDTSLLGLELFAQAIVLDPHGAFGPGQAAFGNGLRIRIGE